MQKRQKDRLQQLEEQLNEIASHVAALRLALLANAAGGIATGNILEKLEKRIETLERKMNQ